MGHVLTEGKNPSLAPTTIQGTSVNSGGTGCPPHTFVPF